MMEQESGSESYIYHCVKIFRGLQEGLNFYQEK